MKQGEESSEITQPGGMELDLKLRSLDSKL